MTMRDHTPPPGGLYLVWLSDSHYYGGRTTCYKRRWATHLRDLKRGKHENTRMQNTYNKYGVFRAEAVGVGDRDLVEAEQEWLDEHFRTAGCMNISKSAAGGCTSRSEETRRRMSETRKSRPDLIEKARQSLARNACTDPVILARNAAKAAAHNTGKKHTPEHIEKRVAAHLGRTNTPETLARMSESAKRRAAEQPTEHGAETRALISRQQKGRVWINDGARNRRVFPAEARPLLDCGWSRGRRG